MLNVKYFRDKMNSLLDDLFAKYTSCDPESLAVECLPPWDEVEQAVSSNAFTSLRVILDRLSAHTDPHTHNNPHRRYFFNTYSWETFDLLFSLSLVDDYRRYNEIEGLVDEAVLALVESVRVREWEIMLFEKIHSRVEHYSTFRLLLFSVQCLLLKQADEKKRTTSLRACLPLVLQKLQQLSTSREEVTDGGESVDEQHIVTDSLCFLSGVLSGEFRRVPSFRGRASSCAEEWLPHTSVFLSFLAKLVGQYVARWKDSKDRDEMLRMIASFASQMAIERAGNHFLLLNALTSLKLSHFQASRQRAKAKHANAAFSQQREDLSLNKAFEEKSDRDFVWKSVSARGERIDFSSTEREVVANVALLSPFGSSQAGEKRSSVEEEDPVGISLLLFTLLRHRLSTASPLTTDAEDDFPFVYDPSFLRDVFAEAMQQLIVFMEISSREGLDALVALYPSTGRTEDVLQFKRGGGKEYARLFVPHWAVLSSDEVLQNYHASSDDREARQACLIACQSIQTWNVLQCIISGLSAAIDSRKRTGGFHSLKCFLGQLSTTSCWLLLSHALAECPYAHMKGALLDLVKTFVQLDIFSASSDCGISSKAPTSLHAIDWKKVIPGWAAGKLDSAVDLIAASERDIALIVNRAPHARSLERTALSLTQCEHQEKMVFYSPLTFHRFVLSFISDIWRRFNQTQNLSTDDIDAFGAVLNLALIFFGRIRFQISQANYEYFSDSQEVTFLLRNFSDCAVILNRIKAEALFTFVTDKNNPGEKLRIDLLQVNIDCAIEKIVEILNSFILI